MSDQDFKERLEALEKENKQIKMALKYYIDSLIPYENDINKLKVLGKILHLLGI